MFLLPLDPHELATVLGGRWSALPLATFTVADISTDSREVQRGKWFIPLKGEHFDGHHFIAEALAQGAIAACCEASYYQVHEEQLKGLPILIVADTLQVYQALGRWWRQQLNPVTIAITGSSGKTSTKEILAALLSSVGEVHKTPLNYNNEIGVPKTLLMLRAEHRFAILEMGMRGLGQIAELAAIAEPDWGIITNIGIAHVGELGSQAAVAQAKWELMDYLSQAGKTGVLLDTDPWMQRMASQAEPFPQLWVGYDTASEIKIISLENASGGQWVTFAWRDLAPQRVWLNLPGAHQARNLALCLGVFYGLGFRLTPDFSLEVAPLFGRNQWIQTPEGVTLIQDAYNANPDSMRAALQVLAETPAQRRVAILGVMGELGEDSAVLHQAIGEATTQLPLDQLIVVGEEAKAMVQGAASAPFPVHFFVSAQEAIAGIPVLIQPGDVVLLKASRSAAFEQLLPCLGVR